MTPFQHQKANKHLLRLRRVKPSQKPISVEREIIDLCRALGVSTAEIKSPSRKDRIVLARMIVIHRLRERGLKLTEIGQILHRAHGTVIYALKQYDNLKSTKNREFIEMLDKVKIMEE